MHFNSALEREAWSWIDKQYGALIRHPNACAGVAPTAREIAVDLVRRAETVGAITESQFAAIAETHGATGDHVWVICNSLTAGDAPLLEGVFLRSGHPVAIGEVVDLVRTAYKSESTKERSDGEAQLKMISIEWHVAKGRQAQRA